MYKGRLLGRPFFIVRRVLTQFNIKGEVHRKLDRLFRGMSGIPMVLFVSEHQAVADHLLTSIHKRYLHLTSRSIFDIDKEVKLRASI
jgi:hypothetical protein